MRHTITEKKSWEEALQASYPLLLPAAHNALTARLIEQAGFDAYQIGGFALVGTMHAVPDVDLEHFGEKAMAVENTIGASSLPVLVDADDGYGDAKNVTRTVQVYARMGISALFIEDQIPPKRCGHMADKKVVPVEQMENKIRAAVDARGTHELFLLARTDAIGPESLSKAIRRAEHYRKAGADGVYFDGVESVEQLEKIGKEFKGFPLATSVMEGGGKTPVLTPKEFGDMGFSMLLYPTTILFQITRTIQRALEVLKNGAPMAGTLAVDMEEFEQIVGMQYWASIEKRFSPSSQAG